METDFGNVIAAHFGQPRNEKGQFVKLSDRSIQQISDRYEAWQRGYAQGYCDADEAVTSGFPALIAGVLMGAFGMACLIGVFMWFLK